MERLWSARDARGLAPDHEFEAGQRPEGELGYGLALFGDRFTSGRLSARRTGERDDCRAGPRRERRSASRAS